MDYDLELKKKALFILGNDYDKLDEETQKSLDVLYESCVIKSLTKYRWGFARKTDKLTGTSISNNKYKYRSDLPDKFLTLINLYDDIKETSINEDYDLTTKLYTNQQVNYLRYIKRIDAKDFPTTFSEYLIYELACEWCYNLTGDTDLQQFLEAKKNEKYEIACNIDARQRKPYTPLYNPFNDIR